MFSLVGVGKEWAGPVFLHPANYPNKVDVFSCRGSLVRVGKDWAGPVFPCPLISKGCMCIHDRVRLMLSLVRVGN